MRCCFRSRCQHAGTAGSADGRSVLNTKKDRFVPLKDVKVDVRPAGEDPHRVRRRIVAAEGAHGPCYLIAKDILKVWHILL